MAAVEHSPLCQSNQLCLDIAELTRTSVPLLYALNLIDFILEVFAFLLLLACAYGAYNGCRHEFLLPLLFLLLIVDLILQFYAVITASNAHPTAQLLKNAFCLDQSKAVGR